MGLYKGGARGHVWGLRSGTFPGYERPGPAATNIPGTMANRAPHGGGTASAYPNDLVVSPRRGVTATRSADSSVGRQEPARRAVRAGQGLGADNGVTTDGQLAPNW